MTEFSINVNVGGCARIELGVSPQLQQLLDTVLGSKEKTLAEKLYEKIVRSDNPEPPNRSASVDPTTENAQQLLEEIKSQCDAAAEHEPLTTEKVLDTPIGELPSLLSQEPPTAEEEPSQETAPQQYDIMDKEYIRAAMDAVRTRIEGPGWENDTNSESYKKYHKQLTSTFKSLALQLGGSKPTELPTAEQRIKFVDEIRQIKLNDNGELVLPKVPF